MKKPPLDFTLYFSGLLLLILSLFYLYTELSNWETAAVIRVLTMGAAFNTAFLMWRFYYIKRLTDNTFLELTKLQYIKEEITHYRQYRHDHKNHMIVIHELADSGAIEEIRSYTEKMIEQDNDTYFDFTCGLVALDVLLYAKLQWGRDSGIDIGMTIDCDLSQRTRHIVDLVSILANVIDNAHQATMGIEIAHERMLKVAMTETPMDLVITVTNSFSPQNPVAIGRVFERGYSTKKDQGNQGLGLSIVTKITKRLGGTIALDVFNGVFFQLKIELPKHRL